MNESAHLAPTGGATGEFRLDRKGSTSLPQRPLLTANIPHILENRPPAPQTSSPVDERSFTASADVNGLTITCTTAKEIGGDYEISQSTSDDKERMISCVQEKAPRFASFLNLRQPKSLEQSPWSIQVPTLASTSTETVLPGEDGDAISMINLSKEQQVFDEV